MYNVMLIVSAAIGNKTHCDICNSKAMRRARAKKEQKDPAAVGESSDVGQEEANASASATTGPTHHHSTHDEGIANPHIEIYPSCHSTISLYLFFSLIHSTNKQQIPKNYSAHQMLILMNIFLLISCTDH